ncbi:hypothetical protein P872_20870 [Rhodonellum psychrophilum GCM71 = DSM 17998]|uniref:Uncharacterized protein n=2 Tax=Rhodonellum TaxID=336827 RepID=U5BT43_9BACT|nr:hypothetical protein P872_20870 [Rhodonellum psychrophilum GCM71 = DSM 17998]SDZ23075.1 hypothetical protein SAMN05444412_10823 [Rhodonellum ikkaensis]
MIIFSLFRFCEVFICKLRSVFSLIEKGFKLSMHLPAHLRVLLELGKISLCSSLILKGAPLGENIYYLSSISNLYIHFLIVITDKWGKP